MSKKRRRITKADIKFVSFCTQGKNGMPVLYKSDDGTVEIQTLSKMDEGMLTAVVWPPNKVDSEGDFIDDLKVIEDMAHSHARNKFALDLHHDGKKLPDEAAYVGQSFIIQKGDPRFQNWKDNDGNTIPDLAGGWAQIYHIQDSRLRKAYRKGLWNGVSLFGPATVEILDKSVEPNPRNKTMDEETLAKAIKRAFTPEPAAPTEDSLCKAVVEALTKSGVIKKADEPEAKPTKRRRRETVSKGPRLSGDYSPEAIERYRLEKQAYELVKAIEEESEADDVDVELVQDLCEDLATVQKAMEESELFDTGNDDADDDDDDDDSHTVTARKAKSQARRARRGLSKGGRGKKGGFSKEKLADLMKGADPVAVDALETEEDAASFAAAGSVIRLMNPAKEA